MIKVGHRGARAYEPENTIRSYKKAVELGVDMVELDVRKTKDNQLVVIHDADVKKVAGVEGLVAGRTRSQIKALSLDKSEKVPTLEEALAFLCGKVKVFVELKEAGTEQQILDTVRKAGMDKQVVLISFSEDVLKAVKQLSPEMETGLVYAKHKNPLKAAIELKAQWLVGFYKFVHTANVRKAHDNDLKVEVWNVKYP
jgi:glycerophosphoryl diester phosphodiesterase